MLKCNDISERISAWIDNKLESNEYAELAQHIKECPSCQAKVSLEQYTKMMVKTKLPLVSPPTGLYEKITNNLKVKSRISWLERIPLLQPIPLTTALASLIVLFLIYTTWFTQPLVTDVADWEVCKDAIHSHELDEQGKFIMDYTESNPQVLVQLVNASHRRDFNMSLPNYNTQKFEIKGCRFCEMCKKPSIYLSFQRQGHLISLEMLDATHIKFPKAKTQNVNGVPYYRGKYEKDLVLIWKKNNLVYAITSDLPEKELAEMISPEMSSRTNIPTHPAINS